MLVDRTVQFADEVLDLIDDFVPGIKTRIIAEQLVRSAMSTAANYRAARRARSRAEFSSKTCTVLEEADESKFWLERIERKRLSSKLERFRHAIASADEIIAMTFSSRRTAQTGGNERQRTSANVSERQRTSANVSEPQRTAMNPMNVNERQ
jgi:four helix bundle protein